VAEDKYDGWEIIEPRGQGGQSDVFLVRSPERAASRERNLEHMKTAFGGGGVEGMSLFAQASWDYARPDEPSEVGALKRFKIRDGGSDGEISEQSQERLRLKNEIAVLKEGYLGLPKLLASSEKDCWIVTELFPEGSLERQLSRYRGKVLLALKAFRSLVETVEALHAQKIVHRDIKPANIFVRNAEELVLGDLGIVFLPDAAERVTVTNEKVGPKDYMAPWLDTGERVDTVEPCSDVYMLGKLLWCMVAGKLKLPFEDFRERRYDLTKIFPDSPDMERVSLILDRCVVHKPNQCLKSASELLKLVDETIAAIENGGNRILPNGSLRLGCVICGMGTYALQTPPHGGFVLLRQFRNPGGEISGTMVNRYACNVCQHQAFFSLQYPEEFVKRK
jgi:serine/threonine protein kinase